MDNSFRSLRLKNIRKEFPGVLALDNVSLEAKAGRVHALMGENGAGKSTLIKILAGAYSKDQGTILFDNKEVNIDNPNDSLNLGIKVVYQEIALIPEFTVAENIFLEKFPVNSLGIVNWKKLYNDCNNLLKKIGFNLNVKEKVVDLSISEQQIVEIARAIFQNSLVVVMDEPTSSLTPNEIEKLFEVIENLKKNNIILPKAADPVGSYVATKIIGKMLFISGQISVDENGELIKGKVGKDLDTLAGYNAAKRCALNIIAQVKKACNDDLSKVKSCVKLTGFVNSTDEFIEQPKVINGASDMMASIFGDAGTHTRAAVSSNSLPLGVSVEVDAIFELN